MWTPNESTEVGGEIGIPSFASKPAAPMAVNSREVRVAVGLRWAWESGA